MRHFLCILLVFLFSKVSFPQFGKDGTLSISSGTTIINQYASLSNNVTAGQNTISVTSIADLNLPSNLTCGDLIMIYQAQGATINTSNTNQYGSITSYGNAGLYELHHVTSVSSNTIMLDAPLNNSYFVSGHTQVVKVPQYTTLNIGSLSSVTTSTWNGNKGGVLVLHALDSITINGEINATGKGFRKGSRRTSGYVYNGTQYVSTTTNHGGEKGESIAGSVLDYDLAGGRYCRGAPANGGGGGTNHNAGGGGGANANNGNSYNGAGVMCTACTGTVAWTLDDDYALSSSLTNSSGGGKGGNTYANSDQNAYLVSPGNSAWSGDGWRNVGGRGGHPLTNINALNRIYFGGGGGAGDANDNSGGNGANGGGLIILISPKIKGTGKIIANGDSAQSSFNIHADGLGGGGGGGSIILNSDFVESTIQVNATGGKGGSMISIGGGYVIGSGAGGGGGYLTYPTGSAPIVTISGGQNGKNYHSWIAEFPTNGATIGGDGLAQSIPIFTLVTNINYNPNGAVGISSVSANTICAGQPVTIIPTGAPDYSLSPGNVSGTSFTVTPSSSTTYTIYGLNSCSFSYTTVTINVSPLSFNSSDQTICSGQTATLSASGATNYTWQPNNLTTSSILVSPTVTSIYTVTGSNGSCSSTQTVMVNVEAVPNLAVNNLSVCSGASATLSVSGASNYTWSPASSGNANMSTFVVIPGTTTIYTVTGSNSTCSSSTTATVYILPPPSIVLSIPAQTVCTGSSVTLTASGATTYSWTNSGSSSASFTINPLVTSIYTVNGFSNEGCMSIPVSGTVTVLPVPDLAITGNTAICQGETTTLIAGGANTYTWSTGSSSTFLTVSPSATTAYTLNGTSANGCTSTNTVLVSVGYFINAGVIIDKTDSCSGNILFKCTTSSLSNTWNFSNGESVINSCDFSHQFSDAGNYTLVYITNPNASCADTLTITFSLSGTLAGTEEIPNVFTPNNDGVNDVFDFSDIAGCKIVSFDIFDRWGLLILSSAHQRFWDGRTTSGEPVSDGTYFYILKTSDGSLKGTVTVFR